MSRIFLVAATFFLLTLGLAACAGTSQSFLPNPSKSTNISTKAGGFIIDDRKIRYHLRLALATPYPTPIYVEAFFDNPSDPNNPLKISSTLPANQKEFEFRSPGFTKIGNPANYKVKFHFYQDSSKKTLLAKHEQELLFRMDPGLLAASLS